MQARTLRWMFTPETYGDTADSCDLALTGPVHPAGAARAGRYRGGKTLRSDGP